MTIVNTKILPRDSGNTITLDTNYNDLNLKAKTLADDVVAFVEKAIGDVDTAATAIDGTMQTTLAATTTQAELAALAKTAAESASAYSTNKAIEAAASAADAVAVVTGGTASLTPSPGKIPIADANGDIDPNWYPLFLSCL